MSTDRKILSELLALEKKGEFNEALRQIDEIYNRTQIDISRKSLNINLLEQRLRARLLSGPTKTASPPSQQSAKSDTEPKNQSWSAIITMWKRGDYFSEQIAAIRAQSIPPQEIIVILNEHHLTTKEIREIGGPDLKIIHSDINSLYTRWAAAYIAKGEYISVFDDDVIPGKYWIANAIRACANYNALVGPSGRIYNNKGLHGYYKIVAPDSGNQDFISCNDTDVYCDWVCNSYLFKREWVGSALEYTRHNDSHKTFDDIQLSTSLYLSSGVRCVTPMQPDFDKSLHGSLQNHYGNDAHAVWKTNSDKHFSERKSYIEHLINNIGYIPIQQRDSLFRFHLIVPFGDRAFLERCLLSVKGQDYRNFTCTLIDDCCDDKEALRI